MLACLTKMMKTVNIIAAQHQRVSMVIMSMLAQRPEEVVVIYYVFSAI